MPDPTCSVCGASCKSTHRFCPHCGAEMAQKKRRSSPAGRREDPFLGMNIGGKFVLRRLIGSGGMGNVYLAEQVRVGRTAAVKIMHRHLLGDERAAARFINEAQAASQLNHPHSISVIDFGQTEAGLLYIVMEYLRGRSLDKVIQEEYPLTFGRVITIMCQVLDAVSAAHRLNIIHRDLKPENIFLESTVGQDFVKVLDFGVAKILETEVRSVTSPGLVPGTPEYMSPEQARGSTIDNRSDVYALGVILYEMLTEFVPFKGRTALETMMSHVQDKPIPPSTRRPDRRIPATLDSIVLWALAKSTDDRIRSAGQFRDLLSAWAEVSGIWPSSTTKEDHERPITQQGNMLTEFFSDDEISDLRSEGFRPEEQSSIYHRPLPPLKESAQARMERGPILGREKEVDWLEKFITSKNAGVMAITAPDGGGKSRLLREVLAMVRKSTSMEVIHCPPEPGWTPVSLSAIHRLVAHLLRVDRLPETFEELRQAAVKVRLEESDLPGLTDLLVLSKNPDRDVLSTSERLRERALSLRNLIEASSAIQPVLVIFEEIQHYDPSSQELVTWLAHTLRSPSVKMVLSRSPRHVQPLPHDAWQLSLPPLDGKTSGKLVERLFEMQDPVLTKAITDVAKGNPLFLQQLSFAQVFENLRDPPSELPDLLGARVERLGIPEREILQWMAVINEEVSREELLALSSAAVETSRLDVMVEKGYLREVEGRYSFVHRLPALVVQTSIPAEVRRGMHQAVAQKMRERAHEPATRTLLAYHASEAEDVPQALDELHDAGEWAFACLDPETAVQLYSKALEMVRKEWGRGRLDAQALDNKAVELTLHLARALRQTGDVLTARGILEEILSVAAGEALSRGRLRLELGRINLDLGRLQRAARQLTLARTDANSAGDPELKRELDQQLARTEGLLGRKDEAGRMLTRGGTGAYLIAGAGEEEPVSQPGGWRSLLERAKICTQINLQERAFGLLLDALQQAEDERSPAGKLRVNLLMADMHNRSNEWSMAEMKFTQVLNLLRTGEIGYRTLKFKVLLDLGRIRRIQGDATGGRRHLEKALRMALEVCDWQAIERAEHEMDMLRFAQPKQL